MAKMVPGFSSDNDGDEGKKKKAQQHPRQYIDQELTKNYPGKNLEQLDEHNVPVVPGKPDTPEMRSLRKGYKPSIEGGPRVAMKP